jgi:hypothetical protein
MRDTAILSREIPAECEAIIRRFEQAWQGQPQPDLESYLPSAQPVDTRLLFELVHIDLDFRLRKGEPARVEHYLERYLLQERDRAALLELIVAEYALRRHWQGEAALEEYLDRFPQHQHELRVRLGAATEFSGEPGQQPPSPLGPVGPAGPDGL